MAKKKQILFPVIFMLVLTMVYTFVLAFINESTAERINELEALDIKRSVLFVLDVPVDEDVSSTYDRAVEEAEIDDTSYYIYSDQGEVSGYVFPFTGTGLWGSISGYISFTPDFTKILGIDFVAHSETPGLGGRIDEEWFKDQFRGLEIKPEDTVIFKPADGGNIDGITGATLTSDSVRKIVNAFIADILSFAKEANL